MVTCGVGWCPPLDRKLQLLTGRANGWAAVVRFARVTAGSHLTHRCVERGEAQVSVWQRKGGAVVYAAGHNPLWATAFHDGAISYSFTPEMGGLSTAELLLPRDVPKQVSTIRSLNRRPETGAIYEPGRAPILAVRASNPSRR